PFRLTRMLTMAMEVGGIEGSFKMTAINTMRVLRDNRDSLMAVLEAFVYDPLVSWHYLQDNPSHPSTSSANPAADIDNPLFLPYHIFGKEQQNLLLTNTNTKTNINTTSHPHPHPHSDSVSDSASDSDSVSDPTGDKHKAKNTDKDKWQMANPRAIAIVQRILSKLRGRDFDPKTVLSVHAQIDYLVADATSSENLSQCYIGWGAFW
ncbi:Phosphatidylinositol 3-kinase tor1, partial [Zancudomyces culisetae]